MTSPMLAGAAATNNNGGRLSEPTDGYGQAPAVGSNDTPRHPPYMPRPDVAGPGGAGLGWVQDVHVHSGPIYLRIVNTLERTINRGGLAPGQRLPSQRALAQQLGVDLTTVTRAFDEARKRGLIEARGPQGSFIAPPKAGFDQAVDLSMNVPPVPDADALADMLRRGAAAVLARSNAPNLMTYHLGGGNPTDRHAAARWLQPMLGTVDDARLLLTEGAQVALAAILVSQGREGDAILCDRLVYPGLLQAAAALGRRLVTVEGDEQGMCPEALARRARECGARLVYLNPTCQNPTALTVPTARREALARVLEHEGLLAIEDAGTSTRVPCSHAVEGDQPGSAYRVRAMPERRPRRSDGCRTACHAVDGPSAGIRAGQPAAAGWFGAGAAGAGARGSTRAHADGAVSAGAFIAGARRWAACVVPGARTLDRCHAGAYGAAAGPGDRAFIGVLSAGRSVREWGAAVVGIGCGSAATGERAAADRSVVVVRCVAGDRAVGGEHPRMAWIYWTCFGIR